jgi:hypothetical protein
MTDEYDTSLLILRKCQQFRAHIDYMYKRCKSCFKAYAIRHDSFCSLDLIHRNKRTSQQCSPTLTADSYCRTREPSRIAAEAVKLSDFISNSPMNTTNSDHRYDLSWALTSFRRRSRLRSSNKDLANESRSPVPSEQNTSAGYPNEKIRAPGSSFGRKS